MASTLHRYLAKHASPEAALTQAIEGSWDEVAVMPVHNEKTTTLSAAFAALAQAGHHTHRTTLLIVVLNARCDDPSAIHRCHAQTRQYLRDLAITSTADAPAQPLFTLHQLPSGLDLLLIDRASPETYLPARGGVGHARRLGADVAAALIHSGRVTSSWIWSLDADAEVPHTLFTLGDAALEASPQCAALVVPFTHVLAADPYQAEAGQLYDLSLRYYVLGLAWAGSPWAYWTLGSALAARCSAYGAVRGFPRRKAGEDFYLLGKLAKQGPLYRGHGPPLRIQARASDRVPFGTGPAVRRWSQHPAPRDAFPLYHPHCFQALRHWLAHLPTLAQGASQLPSPPDCPWLPNLLDHIGAPKAIHRAQTASNNPQVRLRHLNTWFDAFRTLKLIHICRDRYMPSLVWSEAIRQAPFGPPSGHIPSELTPEWAQKRYLEQEHALGPALLGLGSRRPKAT